MMQDKINSELPSIYVVYWFEPYLWSHKMLWRNALRVLPPQKSH